ncbi:hypothetical protein SESBI_42849 [Sesbania bispinosa]|nr:hypothetical protein SESBI_42849 [Sesbania bispinosa]
MGDSQRNNKGKGKDKENYEAWTKEDSDELLHLIVDAIKSGLRDANGSLSKLNVSRMKWFKKQYNNIKSLPESNEVV